MRALQSLLNKLFNKKQKEEQPASPNLAQEPKYGTKIGSVTYVTTEDARRLINTKPEIQPTDELQSVTKDAMLGSMVSNTRTEMHKDWKENGWNSQELNALTGTNASAQVISPEEQNAFNNTLKTSSKSESPLRVDTSAEVKKELNTQKEEMKTQIKTQQSNRTKSLKKKKKSTTASKKRKK